MPNKITGKEYPISKIFSSDFDYYIPAYQRPYSWTEEETGTLFDDLYDFYKTQKGDNYFLGSIVLIKDDNIAKSEVIDGQQRLTTLSILISVIAFNFDGDLKEDYKHYLKEPGRISQNLPANPRLHLRSKDQDFFKEYIQEIKLNELLTLNPESLDSEAKKHIYQNTKLLIDKVNLFFNGNADELIKFGSFLVQQCFLVVVYTPSQASAFRVFSVMNSRGLDLLPTDIIKADIISQISDDERDYYTNKWENIENTTTRNGFNDLFTYIRMIVAKTKPKRNLLDEFREVVLKTNDSKNFINNILEPYAEAFITLKNKQYKSISNKENINDLLEWLNKIDNSDWLPPAIKFLSIYTSNSDYVFWFIRKLERLASYLFITAKDNNKRIERYARILKELEKLNENIDPKEILVSLELTNIEQKEFYDKLNGDIYNLIPKRRNYVILRLDNLISCGGAQYNKKLFTIEHILPQNVSLLSEWNKLWPDIELREFWLNKLANLVPLTRSNNSKAQNYNFADKKRIYFNISKGVTSFALTTQILNIDSWTPAIVEKRQKELIDILVKYYELSLTKLNEVKSVVIHASNNETNVNNKASINHIEIYSDLIKEFSIYPRNLSTKRGLQYFVYVKDDNLYVEEGHNCSEEMKAKIRIPRLLPESEFLEVLKMYKQNKTIGKEVHNITNNASYWYGIFNELRL